MYKQLQDLKRKQISEQLKYFLLFVQGIVGARFAYMYITILFAMKTFREDTCVYV